MEKNLKHVAVVTLASFLRKTNFNPEYQRDSGCWSKQQNQLLVDTMLINGDIPKFYLRKVSEGEWDYEVVDGKQRFTSILEFMQNKYPLGESIYNDQNLKGRKYSELPEDAKSAIDMFQLDVMILDGTKEEVIKMFLRLQNGSPLRSQEKRNAILGNVKDFVKEVVAHPFFKNVPFSGNRNEYDKMAGKLIILELMKGDSKIGEREIDELYAKYNDDGLPASVQEKVLCTLNFMQNAFPDKNPLLKKNTIHSLYMVVSTMIDNLGLDVDKWVNDFSTWFQVFENLKDEQGKLPMDDRDPVMKRYINLISNGTGNPDSLKGRRDIMLKSWEGYVKQLIKQESPSKTDVEGNKDVA